MSEPKRWTTRRPSALDPKIHTSGLGEIEVVAAEDYDRLREERDELIRVSAANIVTTTRNVDEARALATRLADALRDFGPCMCEEAECECGRCAALAVFDAKESG